MAARSPFRAVTFVGCACLLACARPGRPPGVAGLQTIPTALDQDAFEVIEYPAARRTFASAVNGRGEIGGLVETADGKTHGFVWRDGRFETVDVPGAEFTMIRGLNDRGDRVGAIHAPGQRDRAYRKNAGTVTYIDVPGAITSTAFQVNNRGAVVGSFMNADSVVRGFLYDGGTFRMLE